MTLVNIRRSPLVWVALVAALLLVIALVVAGFALRRADDSASGDLTPVTLFMSYVPSVQFAHVYVAAERGYFADEGIDIRFENGFNEADGVERLAGGDLQFGLVSGEQVILARAQGRPVVYVYEWYEHYPVGIVAPLGSGITQPADLAGKVVGIPGPQGASYTGLRALLKAGGLTEDDLGELRSIGFTAPEHICEGAVDAAVVYVVNEPLTIEQQCTPVEVLRASDYAPLVANGLVTNEQTIREQPELVRGMVHALARGVADVIADSDAAFLIAVEGYVTDLADDQRATQRQVLANSIALWDGAGGGTALDKWETTQALLIEMGLLDAPLDDLSACFDMRFLPEDAG